MADLLLLRHGESEWNVSRRYQGQADPPLTALGEEQARRAAERVPPVAAVASSDLTRASRTATLIAAHLELGPVVTCPALRERSVGEWTGLAKTDVDRMWPGQREARLHPPGWEDNASVVRRALAALHELAEKATSTLVVTHRGVVYAIEDYLGEEFVLLDNLEGRWVHLRDGEITLGPRIALLDSGLPTPSYGGPGANTT